jgi:TPR repeat protein
MQLLGMCYMGGKGVPRDEHLSVMWIARAAAQGHAIAQAQRRSLGIGLPGLVLPEESVDAGHRLRVNP